MGDYELFLIKKLLDKESDLKFPTITYLDRCKVEYHFTSKSKASFTICISRLVLIDGAFNWRVVFYWLYDSFERKIETLFERWYDEMEDPGGNRKMRQAQMLSRSSFYNALRAFFSPATIIDICRELIESRELMEPKEVREIRLRYDRDDFSLDSIPITYQEIEILRRVSEKNLAFT